MISLDLEKQLQKNFGAPITPTKNQEVIKNKGLIHNLETATKNKSSPIERPKLIQQLKNAGTRL